MKKVLALVLVALLALGSFTVAEELYTPQKTEYNFVFIPKLVHVWYETVKTGIEKAIAEYAEQGITINYTWDAQPTADILVHAQKIESAAAKNPDAISTAVLDPASDTAVINSVVAAGIPVCTFDNDAPESDRLFFAGNNDNKQDGIELGELLAEQIGYKGEVAILAGTLGAPSHMERIEGFKEVMAKYPDIEIVAEYADEDSIEKAVTLTENIINSNPNVVGIFCCNAANPVGAARAVVDAGLEDKITIVGMDDDPETMSYIADGVIYATRVQNVADIGYYSVLNMVKIADGVMPESDVYSVGSYTVTQENLDEYYAKSGKTPE